MNSPDRLVYYYGGNTMNREMPSNDEPVATTGYDYGYEACAPTPFAGRHDAKTEQVGMMDMIYPKQDLCSFPNKGLYNDQPDCSDRMPPGRLTPKRTFSRRNGAGHSHLLKSAVMAAMETQDNESLDGTGIRAGRSRRDSLISLQDSLAATHDGHGAASPRKRARLKSVTTTSDNEDELINDASDLFGSMCNVERDEEDEQEPAKKDFARKAPIRRVSRRTSYDSRISDDMSDLDGLSDFDD